MAHFSDLPPDILYIIFQDLPLSGLLSICRVCQYLNAVSLPFLVATFQSCDKKQNLKRLELFLNKITGDHRPGPHVKSVLLGDIDNDDDIAKLGSLVSQVLYQASNIQKLAIPGHPSLLELLRDYPPQHLQELHCVNCGPEIWGIVHHFPRLSRLSLKNLCERPTVELSVSSLPIERLLLDGCDLDSEALCIIIKSCKRLVSFKYLHPPQGRFMHGPLDAHKMHEALLQHKSSLEEFVVEDLNTRLAYDETPKFGSFEEFAALQRLGVECNTLSVRAPLPPSLRSIAVRHCDEPFVLFHLAKHPLLEAIQFNDDDGGSADFFRQCQSSGKIRKDIQVHLLSPYLAILSNHSDLVSYPLPWYYDSPNQGC